MTKKQKRSLIEIIAGILLTAAAYFVPVSDEYRFLPFIVPYLVMGHGILIKALSGIKRRQIFDENFLMATATVGAFVIGEYLEAVAVLIFYSIGELFENYAVGKSRRDIAALMNIRPDSANLLIDGEIKKVTPEQLHVGDEIVVFPGEKVPVDGVVTQGKTQLETVALTGESLPVEVCPGQAIYSSSVNLNGKIKVEVTKEFGESTVSKILSLIETASTKKAKSERFITRFARVYTPGVCIGALALAVVPSLVILVSGGTPVWQDWLFRGLTFLVISCPCALVISVPLSFFGGIGAASKKGILIKGSDYLEKTAKIKTVIFDKTGTLTKGKFEVTDVQNFNCSKAELLSLALTLEKDSNHPIAKGIVSYCEDKADVLESENMQELSGFGVSAQINGKTAIAGNLKLMEKNGITPDIIPSEGTAVYVAVDGIYKGFVCIGDTIKSTTGKAIENLHGQSIKTVMLTGDRKAVADSVAKKLLIDEYHSELLPEQKVEILEEIAKSSDKSSCVAFVGDGINDAPALARADVGIAMGALGSDAAIESADVVLMDDDLSKLNTAIDISKRTLKIVKQNIIFSLVIKFSCLLLGAFGFADMWIAIFADVGVMVLAILNSMRAMKI